MSGGMARWHDGLIGQHRRAQVGSEAAFVFGNGLLCDRAGREEGQDEQQQQRSQEAGRKEGCGSLE